jgi:predicted transcriptional regulator
MAPDARAEAEALRLGEEMDLAEGRRALKLSQDEIVRTRHIADGSVAKIEKRADMYVSTLRRFIEAMGGELEIVARFADHSVKIKILLTWPSGSAPDRARGGRRSLRCC